MPNRVLRDGTSCFCSILPNTFTLLVAAGWRCTGAGGSVFRQTTAILPPRLSGNAEIVVEQLLFGRYLFEIVVVFRHNPFVRLVEPIAFAVVQFVHGLGIKLVVVYRAVGVYCFRHFYADEPATAAGVGQQVLLVAGGDERGVSAHLEHGIGVWLAHVDHRLLEDMFQESLLGAAYLVEFIDVDERKTVEVSSASRLREKSMLSV